MRQARRGNTSTVTVLALVPLLGFAALAVDIGMLKVADAELQGAVDAGALAGVGYLDGTQEGMYQALIHAKEVAERNTVAGERLTVGWKDMLPGVYDHRDESFVVSWDAREVNAIRVDVTFDGVATMFAPAAFGREFLASHKVSTATAEVSYGAGRMACYLPLAVPDCFFTDMSPQESEALALRMYSSGDDNVGWASLEGNPNAAGISQMLHDGCSSGPVEVGEIVYLNNGVISSSLSDLRDELRGGQAWDAARWGAQPAKMAGSTHVAYGRVIEGPMILFKSDPSAACGSSVQYNGTKQITGFAWAVVYDVDTHGSDKNLRVKLDFTNPYDAGVSWGGLDTNVHYVASGGLVR